MSTQSRACDRCAQLKAQCSSGETPCPRCLRLNLCCTRDRPAPARGRPRKNQARGPSIRRASLPVSTTAVSSSDAGDQSSSAPLTFDSPTDFLLASIDLPVPRSLAANLLDRVLDIVQSVGILSAFRRQHHHLLGRTNVSTIPWTDREDELSFVGSRSTLYTLLACGTAFLPGEFPETLSEDCRIYALSDIPILTWKSRTVSRSDAYCLFLLSNLGYLHKESTEMASRWAMLSEMLAFTALPSTIPPVLTLSSAMGGPMELDRRINSLIALNTEVYRVLYNRPSRDRELGPELLTTSTHALQDHQDHTYLPTMSDIAWHQTYGPDSTANAGLPDQGFFDLFIPLQKHLKAAMSGSQQVDLSRSHTAEGLEAFFINFPTSIMELTNVSLLWQLEAMVWFHGIYLLLTCGPDFVNAMVNSNLIDNSVFPHAIDHAILLGEIFPHILKMESAVLRLMPLTIYFLTLSAAVHIGLFNRLYSGLTAPELLTESASKHRDVLYAILDSNKTCDHPFIKCVANTLSLVLSAQDSGLPVELEQIMTNLEELQYYRWTAGGRGLLALDDETAQALLQNSLSGFDISIPMMEPSPALLTVLDPDSRINKTGTFDLSILY